MFRPAFAVSAVMAFALAACDKNAGSVSCGIDAFTGPLEVKESFGKGAALTRAPDVAPASLPVRLVAGPAWRATVARDSINGKWLVTTHGTVSKKAHIGYGVLIVDSENRALGVLAFDAYSIRGAPELGRFVIGDTIVPLLGVRIDPKRIQSAKCPVFPDSLR